jgi:RNA recognition motif-containing protein
LSFEASEDDLRQAFAEYGEVTSAAIIKDRETGRSRGFGFVEMADDSDARRAIENMNNASLLGRTLTVNEARKRAAGGGGGGGQRRERW